MHIPLSLKLFRCLYFGTSKRIQFYRQLHSFARQGIPLKDALETLHQCYCERRDYRQRMTRHWISQVKAGSGFSEALRDWVPVTEQVLIAAGQYAGNIQEGFKRAAWLSEAETQVSRRIVLAVSYPSLILLLLLLMVGWFSVYLIPIFAEVIPPVKWQGSARELYLFSQLINQWGWAFLLAAVFLFVAFFASLPRWCGSLRARCDHLPLYNIYRTYHSAALLISLAAMVRTGIPIYEALCQLQREANPWLREYLQRMCVGLRTGMEPGMALHSPLFDRDTLDELQVYASLQDFNQVIQVMGERIIEQSILKVERYGRLLNAILLALAGLSITWMASALYDLPQGMTQNIAL